LQHERGAIAELAQQLAESRKTLAAQERQTKRDQEASMGEKQYLEHQVDSLTQTKHSLETQMDSLTQEVTSLGEQLRSCQLQLGRKVSALATLQKEFSKQESYFKEQLQNAREHHESTQGDLKSQLAAMGSEFRHLQMQHDSLLKQQPRQEDNYSQMLQKLQAMANSVAAKEKMNAQLAECLELRRAECESGHCSGVASYEKTLHDFLEGIKAKHDTALMKEQKALVEAQQTIRQLTEEGYLLKADLTTAKVRSSPGRNVSVAGTGVRVHTAVPDKHQVQQTARHNLSALWQSLCQDEAPVDTQTRPDPVVQLPGNPNLVPNSGGLTQREFSGVAVRTTGAVITGPPVITVTSTVTQAPPTVSRVVWSNTTENGKMHVAAQSSSRQVSAANVAPQGSVSGGYSVPPATSMVTNHPIMVPGQNVTSVPPGQSVMIQGEQPNLEYGGPPSQPQIPQDEVRSERGSWQGSLAGSPRGPSQGLPPYVQEQYVPTSMTPGPYQYVYGQQPSTGVVANTAGGAGVVAGIVPREPISQKKADLPLEAAQGKPSPE
jgi:hypothetical protein